MSPMKMITNVVVPLDGSRHALAALPVAKAVVELEGATLHVVHVGVEGVPPIAALERVGLTTAELHGAVLDTAIGDAAVAITQAARERGPAIVVMCTYTAASADKIVGRTTLSVLKDAPCPVVLVRPERDVAPWAIRRILLPHDGTPTTSAAIRPAAELARRAGAELSVLHVAAPGARVSREPGALTTSRYVDQVQHEWPAWESEFLDRLAGLSPIDALNVRMFLACGAPDEEVLRAAAQQSSDLIVLAWRGVWDAHGAIVKAIVYGAPCPVLILRAEQ
jgi:nucleotide-binding universal stress UspA family protein